MIQTIMNLTMILGIEADMKITMESLSGVMMEINGTFMKMKKAVMRKETFTPI